VLENFLPERSMSLTADKGKPTSTVGRKATDLNSPSREYGSRVAPRTEWNL